MPLEERSRRILACLGDASRFRLVSTLAESERCVGELALAVGLSQSCTTRHLQALGRLGLVEGRRDGRRVLFRLNPQAPGLEGILVWALSEAGVAALLAADQPTPGSEVGRPGARRAGNSRSAARGRGTARRAKGSKDGETVPESAGEDRDAQAGGGALAEDGPEADTLPRPGDIEDYLL